jgi:hypothetical protein
MFEHRIVSALVALTVAGVSAAFAQTPHGSSSSENRSYGDHIMVDSHA